MGRWTDPADIIAGSDRRTKSGGLFEAAMTEPLGTYCVKNGIPYRIVTGTDEDRKQGTDMRVYGELGLITMNAGILRLDVTHNFYEKDNMPLTWEPTPGLKLRGQDLLVGIRTGNTTAGFQAPVVVLGADMPREDVNAQLTMIRKETRENASRYIYEAGEALAAYAYLTDPNYVAWIDAETKAGNEDLLVPDTSRLCPNYAGRGTLHTNRRSPQTYAGLQAAIGIAQEHAILLDADPEKKAVAMAFLQKAGEAQSPVKASSQKAQADPGRWLRQLEQYQKDMADRDRLDSLEPSP